MTTSPALARQRLVNQLHVCAWQALVAFCDGGARPARVRVGNARHEATVAVGPRGGVDGPGELPPGYFSPIELLVVNAVGADRALTLKEVVRQSGVRYTSELRTLVRNLKARGVLAPRPGEAGVRWSDDFRRLRGQTPTGPTTRPRG
jgi:hypothetical protein